MENQSYFVQVENQDQKIEMTFNQLKVMASQQFRTQGLLPSLKEIEHPSKGFRATDIDR